MDEWVGLGCREQHERRLRKNMVKEESSTLAEEMEPLMKSPGEFMEVGVIWGHYLAAREMIFVVISMESKRWKIC